LYLLTTSGISVTKRSGLKTRRTASKTNTEISHCLNLRAVWSLVWITDLESRRQWLIQWPARLRYAGGNTLVNTSYSAMWRSVRSNSWPERATAWAGATMCSV